MLQEFEDAGETQKRNDSCTSNTSNLNLSKTALGNANRIALMTTCSPKENTASTNKDVLKDARLALWLIFSLVYDCYLMWKQGDTTIKQYLHVASALCTVMSLGQSEGDNPAEEHLECWDNLYQYPLTQSTASANTEEMLPFIGQQQIFFLQNSCGLCTMPGWRSPEFPH